MAWAQDLQACIEQPLPVISFFCFRMGRVLPLFITWTHRNCIVCSLDPHSLIAQCTQLPHPQLEGWAQGVVRGGVPACSLCMCVCVRQRLCVCVCLLNRGHFTLRARYAGKQGHRVKLDLSLSLRLSFSSFLLMYPTLLVDSKGLD